jgi:S-adenosylmethionine hydrolase
MADLSFVPMGSAHGKFQPAGVITLTTDFGLDDPYVGTMKGVIARTAPGLNVIDLSHGVPPFRPEIGGLWLGRCYRWFASGTVHVAVVDPGVGTSRPILCLETADHLFVTPDNGLAGELIRHLDAWTATVLEPAALGLDVASTTFHGRDIFAPVGAGLAAGGIGASDVGPETRDMAPSPLPVPRLHADRIEGEVLFADRFGNVCTNIPGPAPTTWGNARASAGQHTFRLVRAYDEARSGEFVAIFNSFGLLEIALPRGNAMRDETWPPGTPVCLHEST